MTIGELLSGDTPKVKVYDFIDKELGKAVPYGVYDIAQNQGWFSVGISKDTAEFAVNSIRSWWQQMGEEQYPNAKKILITAIYRQLHLLQPSFGYYYVIR